MERGSNAEGETGQGGPWGSGATVSGRWGCRETVERRDWGGGKRGGGDREGQTRRVDFDRWRMMKFLGGHWLYD